MDKFLLKPQKNEEERQSKQGENQNKNSISSKRKYNNSYLEYGFILSEKDNSVPFCMICLSTLSNEAMVPSKLQRHLITNHPQHKDKPKEYFEKMQNNLKNQSKRLKKFYSIPEKAQIASYKIAQLLAKKKKPHTDAENIILPALKIAVESMISDEAVHQIKHIPLSARSISRKIQDISRDIDDQLREHFANAKNELENLWSLQIDESTDISNKAQLIAFLRIISGGKIINQFFFCCELKERTTGEDVFNLVNKNVELREIQWRTCVSVCTDGAPSMQGRQKGFVAHVLQKNAQVKIVHCMIHREVLVSKSLPGQLLKTMGNVIKVVNYIKSNSLRCRLFASLCEKMDSDFKCLLLHTEVRWLSKGKVLSRFISLRAEIISFFDAENMGYDFLHEDNWWLEVTFLNDLFEKLNILNLSLQGANENIITITGKLKSFADKLDLWTRKVKNSQLDCFPGVDASSNKFKILPDVQRTLELLSASFSKYFPSLDYQMYQWVINPFARFDGSHLTLTEEEILIDLKNDPVHKASFSELELSAFWISLWSQYPRLATTAIKSLLPFGSSYLCEFGFSALVEMKSKKRERLQMVDEELRVCLSNLEPRFDRILSKNQLHPSH